MTTGQIQAPSALEFWWERNRKTVISCGVAALIAVFGYYGYRNWRQSRIDETWSRFAAVSGLREAYATKNPMADLVRQSPQYRQFYFSTAEGRLLSGLLEAVRDLSATELAAAIEAAKGTQRQPLLLWIAARKAMTQRSWDEARTHLERLKKDFPNHFLCAASDYPVQYREPVEEEVKEGTKPKDPELTPPHPGSVVDEALQQIAAEQQFRSEHSRFYQAPEPTSKEVAVVKTESGEFRIRFYDQLAPRHVATFLEKARQGYFDGLAVDMISRDPAQKDAFSQEAVQEMHFGLAVTKDQDDRTKWTEERSNLEVEGEIDWEDSGISHFPGMVAATDGGEGKSIPFRVWINCSDAAAQRDGMRVVFGKVVEGLDVVERIVLESTFSNEAESRSGSGMPRDTIRIESVTIQE